MFILFGVSQGHIKKKYIFKKAEIAQIFQFMDENVLITLGFITPLDLLTGHPRDQPSGKIKVNEESKDDEECLMPRL